MYYVGMSSHEEIDPAIKKWLEEKHQRCNEAVRLLLSVSDSAQRNKQGLEVIVNEGELQISDKQKPDLKVVEDE